VAAYVINGIVVAGLPPYSIGYINLVAFAILAATTIPFARVGVRLAHRSSERDLQIVFAAVLILIGGIMLVSR
jgi:uncharacterized membrane protein YfcA